MMRGSRILITGVSTLWGAELARRLERDKRVEAIIGIDTKPPEADLERTEIIEADLRSPLLARLLPPTKVDTIVHCGIVWYPEADKPARALHDINVIGTLQLLAAAEKLPSLRSIVVRGSAAIYGSEPDAPGFFTEEMARRYPMRTRFQRDIGELENYFENYARRHPEVRCCMLRFQPELGPGLDAPLARYLSLPVVPTQLGFDPRLQFVHADDANAALVAAVANPVRGPVNVAPTGTVSLTRLLRLARKPTLPIPHPAFGIVAGRLGGMLGTGDLFNDALRLLRYGRGVDNTRLRDELGFEPTFDATETVVDFIEKTQGQSVVGVPSPVDLASRLVGS